MATSPPRSRLREGLAPAALVPAITAGAVAGIVEVVLATSFAALIFSGPLASQLPAGIGLALFAAIAMLLILAATSSLPGVVGSVQDTSAAILAIMAAAIASRLPADTAFATTVVAIAVTSLMTGAFFFFLGSFRLGNLVRFIPYPVVGGFLAGTGWLLFKGGAGLLARTSLSLAAVAEFIRPELLVHWVPGVAFGLLLLAVLRRHGHFLIIPGAIVGGAALFYAVLLGSGGSLTEAEAGGWLLGPFSGEGLWRPWVILALGDADWATAVGQAGNAATVLILSVLALLLNATGIELVAGRDMDLNRELRVAGAVNVLSGLGGGIVGFHALSLTALAHRTGGARRLVGIVAAGVCAAALLLGASLLSLIPRLVVGGLVIYLGAGFLFEWVVEARRQLPRSDYVVVLLILVVVATLGFLQGVGVGLLVVLVMFVVNYSRTDVVRSSLSSTTYQSNLDRPPAHRDALRSAGERVHILLLHGFLFFGTANRLLERIRTRIFDTDLPKLEFLILDFGRVSGLDSSAVVSFEKALKLSESEGFRFVLAGLSEGLRAQMAHGGFPLEHVRLFPDLDRAGQWCEDQLLAHGSGALDSPDPWSDLRDVTGEPLDPGRLLPYLERIDLPAAHAVMRQGEPSEDVYFLESGRLTAQLLRPDGTSVRLRTMGPGSGGGRGRLLHGDGSERDGDRGCPQRPPPALPGVPPADGARRPRPGGGAASHAGADAGRAPRRHGPRDGSPPRLIGEPPAGVGRALARSQDWNASAR